MRAVHVCVGHDDDLVIAQLINVESPLILAIALILILAIARANAGANGSDHRTDFAVLEHLVQSRLLHVDELAADRQDRLKFPVAPLLGRSTGRVALNDVQLGIDRIAVRAVG